MSLLKSAYVSAARAGRSAARSAGLLASLESRRFDRASVWFRSLFAIYDIEDMASLDLPWWTLEAAEKADAFLKARPEARVFEYGSGASTIWLARRAASVTSVEHDAHWHPLVADKIADHPNAQVKLVLPDKRPAPDPIYGSTKPGWRGRTFRNYVHAIDSEPGLFDVIVIDGRARVACLKRSVSRLAKNGMIIFDNTNRPAYRRAIEALGLPVQRTSGLTACLPYPDETTLIRMPA